MCRRFEVGLFAISQQGTCLVGRTEDPELVRLVREQIAANRRRELARLDSPAGLTPDESLEDEDPGR